MELCDPPIRRPPNRLFDERVPRATGVTFTPHLGWSAPHSVQRKTDLPLDTPSLGPGGSLARSIVVEACVLFLEVQLTVPVGPLRCLADDHLGDAFDALVRLGIDRAIVELLPVDKADDVGVLLDRSRFTEIRELRRRCSPPRCSGARESCEMATTGTSSSFASALSDREMYEISCWRSRRRPAPASAANSPRSRGQCRARPSTGVLSTAWTARQRGESSIQIGAVPSNPAARASLG